MAIDRDAMIPSIFFGDAVKNWSQMTAGNKVWFDSTLVHYDYDPDQAKKLLASLGWKDKNGDGFLEDAQGHTIGFSLKTNSDNKIRVGDGQLHQGRPRQGRHQGHARAARLQHADHDAARDFDYDAMLLGLESATPPDPAWAATCGARADARTTGTRRSRSRKRRRKRASTS
jgi:peptide/nickel transport system substrate-binding protein